MLSCVPLFAIPWTAARQAPLSYHLLPEPIQTHVHRVSDAIQPSHPLSSLASAFNLSQHQSLPMSQFFTAGGQSIGASVPLTRIQEIDLRSTAECRTQHYLRGSLSPSGTFHLCSPWSLGQQIQWQEGGSSYSFGKKKKTNPKTHKNDSDWLSLAMCPSQSQSLWPGLGHMISSVMLPLLVKDLK